MLMHGGQEGVKKMSSSNQLFRRLYISLLLIGAALRTRVRNLIVRRQVRAPLARGKCVGIDCQNSSLLKWEETIWAPRSYEKN